MAHVNQIKKYCFVQSKCFLGFHLKTKYISEIAKSNRDRKKFEN